MNFAIRWCAVLLTLIPSLVVGQSADARPAKTDSAVVIPGPEYAAGGFQRFLLGANYRDLWTTPIRVQVLNLRSFGGGLKVEKLGGGLQTKSLRFAAKDGNEYVFRTVDKAPHVRPPLDGALAEKIFGDQISAMHPAAALVVAPLLDAAHVLHSSPTLMVMPDDSLLGKFRKEFAGTLGLVEMYQGKPHKGVGFKGAVEIINSDSLLTLLNSSATEQVDARAMLVARLMDMFVNDIDRHPGQWKWARMEKSKTALWLPIPRDRDQALVSYHGLFPSLGRSANPNLVVFDGSVSVAGLTYNSLEMDRRLLGGLEKPAWDSVAQELVRVITDSVIDAAVTALPAEYRGTAPQLAATLKIRRNIFPDIANRFYKALAMVADVHATDDVDHLTVTRVDDRFVDVRLASNTGVPFFQRRFDATETHDIHVYLHGGDDSAIVRGDVRKSIPVRIIGGSGTNSLVDSSRVGGHSNPTNLNDVGKGREANYGPDTLFDRRPLIHKNGELVAPSPDRGSRLSPVLGLSFPRDLGVVPRIGLNRISYGFGRNPYASMMGATAEYSTATGGFRFAGHIDQRFEETPFHITAIARMSQLEVTTFHGLGNDTPDSANSYFDVRQRQYMVRPAVAFSFGSGSDLTFGPVLQYTVTESAPNRLLSTLQPYGVGTFAQAGMQIGLYHVAGGPPKSARNHFVLELTGAYYPAVFDVKTAFSEITARAGTVFTLPLPLQPIVLVRAGGRKLYGDFPFFESAFIGGNSTLRSMGLERFAGDASLYATTELRIPLARFSLMVPLEAGLVGVAEAGRVYVGGASPGGWHAVQGGGIFVGRRDDTPSFMITMTNDPGHTSPRFRTGLSF